MNCCIEKRIVQLVLEETGYKHGFVIPDAATELGRLLKERSFHKEIYNSINGEIHLTKLIGPHKADVMVDIKDYPEGNLACDHEFITLEWEEGGGGLDSGVECDYRFCYKCGYSPTKIFHNNVGFIVTCVILIGITTFIGWAIVKLFIMFLK